MTFSTVQYWCSSYRVHGCILFLCLSCLVLFWIIQLKYKLLELRIQLATKSLILWNSWRIIPRSGTDLYRPYCRLPERSQYAFFGIILLFNLDITVDAQSIQISTHYAALNSRQPKPKRGTDFFFLRFSVENFHLNFDFIIQTLLIEEPLL